MEQNAISILIDAAFKLSKLAKANMFVLLETDEGRFYGGEEKLCDAFNAEGLQYLEGDHIFSTEPPLIHDLVNATRGKTSPKPRKRNSEESTENFGSPIKRKKANNQCFSRKVSEPVECQMDSVNVIDYNEPENEKENEVTVWFTKEFCKEETIKERIEMVKSFNDVATLMDKESVERKELLSLFYDYGKRFASKFLYQEEYRDFAFQIFWTQFVNLHPFAEMKTPKRLFTVIKDSFDHPYRRKKRILSKNI